MHALSQINLRIVGYAENKPQRHGSAAEREGSSVNVHACRPVRPQTAQISYIKSSNI